MYSVNGYRRYSRDVDNAFNIIPSGRISMKGVDFPVIGVDEFGIIQFMQPEKEYKFPGNTVFEVPIMQQGGWLPSMDKVKAILNPKNWGVPDYSDKGDFSTAYSAARKAGEKEFMWNNKRFNTKSDLSEEKQMKTYGITDNQRHVRTFLIDDTGLRKNLSRLHTSAGYHTPLGVVKDVMLGNPIENEGFIYDDNEDLDEAIKKEHDAFRLYLGLPQQYDTFKPSKYKKGSFELNNYLQKFPEEMPSDDLINLVGRPLYKCDLYEEIMRENLSDVDRLIKLDLYHKSDQIKPYNDMILGRHTVRKGKDENGEYLEYIDNWDLDTYNYTIPKKQLPFGIETPEIKIPIGRISDKLNKPFNIYGRQYYKDYGDGIKRKQYFSDKELSELDINKKNFDTLALQRELSNRGYKLPISTKEDGDFDGIWGDETKNALLDWQNKNLRTSQQKYQQGGTVGMDGMMKARLALDSHFGNPTARRMTNYDTRNYKFDDGSIGNVYVSSYDNLVTPYIQLDENNNLIYVDDVWSDNNKERSYQQSMKFEREEDAEYFGKNYKRIAPMKKLYQDGGYAQEEDLTTQLLYSIAEALQQGSDPREILNALKQNGVPEEQAMELIKYVMEQMQQQDQLQKEEKQQLEYAQDGKIVRKYNVEDLDWGKGINRAMLAFNMLQTPGLWQVPVKHGVLDALNAGLGLAAGLSGVGLGYSKLGAKKEYLGAKGLEPMKKLTTSEVAQTPEITAKNMTYRPIDPTIPLGVKGLEPMKKLTTSEVAQTPEITAKNMTSKPIEPTILSDSGMSFVVDYLPDSLKQRYKAHFGKQLSDFIDANSTDINTLRSLDLDEDLGTKQDGGYVQEEDPTTQLLYSIAEALQQGSDPREVLNALKQNGVPEEQAMELIKYVMEQMQQQDQLQKEEKQQLEYAQDGKIWNGNYGSYKQYLDNFAQQDFSQFSKQEQTNPEAFKITFNSMYPYLNLNNAESSSIKTKSKDPEDPEDNVKNEETKQTFYTGDPYGMLMANNALVGFQKFNDYLSDKDYEKEYNRRMMQIGNTNAKYNPVNYDNPYGTYTPNVGIGSNYGLVANGPIQDFGTGMFMAEEGGRLPQMPNGGRGIVSDKTVDPDREKTVDVSNKKSNKTSGPFGIILETVRNLGEPLISKPYYFNGKQYKYNPAASEGRKLAFIASDPTNYIKQIDVDIVDFNKALNKDQIVNNYYQKYYPYDNKPDLSKLKLERYYVSDNVDNAKSYEDPDFYTFRGKDSEYKVPHYLKATSDQLYLKNNMDRVIQKDGKLYYLASSYLEDIPYFEEEPQYIQHASNYGFHDHRDGDWYKVGFKSIPKVRAYPLDSNYEPGQYEIFDENDLRNARLAYNPFAKKEEEIVEEEVVKEEPTNTNKTTTTTQSSSKNNTSGKSTIQKENDIMYNPNRKYAYMSF